MTNTFEEEKEKLDWVAKTNTPWGYRNLKEHFLVSANQNFM